MTAVSNGSPLVPASPGWTERRLALIAILASGLCFAVMAPFARTHLPHVLAFVPAYEAALDISELITSILLFGQFARLRRLSLLVIASGYLFNLWMVAVHALTFPGVFSDTGLLGAGLQTTAWIYVFWHGGFPAALLAYALIAGSARDALPAGIDTRAATAASVALTLILAAGVTALSTSGQSLLPAIIANGDYSRMIALGVSPAILGMTVAALTAMGPRRNATVLDTWLFVVLWVWLCDVSLSTVIGSARFDLGWYGSRLFGLLAGSFVLVSLLIELNKLYAELSEALAAAEAQNAELVRSRSELARVQRFEAMGQLTGGIAHDFNNLLTAIVGNLDLIVKKPDAHDRVVRLSSNALKAAQRGTRLISQLMTFARKQNLRPEVLNPNAVLLELQEFANRVAGAAIAVSFRLDHAVYPILVDASEFQSAMLNLISNARDAMPNGGTLTIESGNADVDRASATEHRDVQPGHYARFAVSDNGTGMSPETAAKVFEPFFTTKAVGKGTGLGLSQVYGFSKSANGFVTVVSEPARGSTFTVFIPRSVASQATALNEAVPIRPALAGETVLFVEDDPDVLSATVETLRELGYAVITAITGQDALDVLKRGERIDILFSDVVMPGGMNGVQLAVEARRRNPTLKVLLTSGYTGSALSQQGVSADFPLLAKPYRREELAQQLLVVRSAAL